MAGINVGRWITSGVVASLVIWLAEGAASMLYMGEMETALAEHNLAMEMSAGLMALSVLISLIAGMVLMFVYVGFRPRFGPGPRTAILAAVTLWFGGYLLSLVGYAMLELYSTGLLFLWGVIGLVELIIAALIGGAIYKESPAA